MEKRRKIKYVTYSIFAVIFGSFYWYACYAYNYVGDYLKKYSIYEPWTPKSITFANHLGAVLMLLAVMGSLILVIVAITSEVAGRFAHE